MGLAQRILFYIYAKFRLFNQYWKIGKLECDFILCDYDMNYAYVQVTYTIMLSKETENREFRPLEQIKTIIQSMQQRQIIYCKSAMELNILILLNL